MEKVREYLATQNAADDARLQVEFIFTETPQGCSACLL